MDALLYPIVIPFIGGLFTFFCPGKIREFFAVFFSLATLVIGGLVFTNYLPTTNYLLPFTQYFLLDSLNSFILMAICLFGFLISLYSIKFMEGKPRLREYYTYLLWTLGAACGAVLANNLVLLLTFWGFLGITLYLMVTMGQEGAETAAKKTLIIVGGSDALMLLGIVLLYYLSGTFQMDKIRLPLAGSELAIIAFICLAIASFAKAGAMPFHSWIPDMAEKAPVSTTAYLPASLDKLLGIYLLARISWYLFEINQGMMFMLLIVGAITVVAAVMMALIQHDLKRLLSYHAVSQVGYMILGIGTMNPVGMAGGLFHMLNHAIYKGCLFLCGGGVEHRTGTSDLDKLGGLGRYMPLTFITFLVAAFSISGIPPFNGFVSKWMIYQGIIEMGKNEGNSWIIWLVAAMFGSALTLASFMKLIHATFLGQRTPSTENRKPNIKEVHWTMATPMVVLASLCVIFGVFAQALPVEKFLRPIFPELVFTGVWSSSLATFLIIIGLLIGGIIYALSKADKFRRGTTYVGGEELTPEMRVSGVKFYDTVKDIPFFANMYKKAQRKLFDVYDQGTKFTFFFTRRLQRLHSGILPLYLIWCLVGMVFLFLVFFAA